MAGMFRTISSVAVMLTLVAGTALAQEFGRASGGELNVLTKQPSEFSGSLGLSRSSLFGGRGYEGTLGGSLLKDKMWFFGSGLRTDAPATVNRFNIVLPRAAAPTLTYAPTPSWFGNVKSTNIISPSSFFTVNVSQSVAH
jgi:hypothetical protein